MTTQDYEPFALFDDATWPGRPALLLTGHEGTIEAARREDVSQAFADIEAAVAGGAVAAGYCAYELGYLFEPRLARLMPPADRPLLRFHLFSRSSVLSSDDRQKWLVERTRGSAVSGHLVPSLSAERHRVKVDRVRNLIGDGDVYQVNLTFKLKAAAGDPFATYAALRASARSGGCAFLRFGDEDILSFSPEMFFRVQGNRIAARPMKGTSARGASVAADELARRALVTDEKQRAENLMIVDLLRNDLGRLAKIGSVRVTDLFTIETYPRFHTLTSGIEAQLYGAVPLDRAFASLFPCGSVTGAPKIRAMEIIREVEEAPRGVYCGAVGYVSRHTTTFNVAIRTLVLRDGTAEMGVGGGIVWDSRAADEYEECLLKARFFREISPPFRLIETLRWTPSDGFHLLTRHMRRLRASSRYFGFIFDEAFLRDRLNRSVLNLQEPRRVRLTLGERGDVETSIEPFAMHESGAIWRYAIAATPVHSSDWRVHHKTTARAFFDDGLAAARAATGCDEAVFLNERGEVTEGSRCTVFLERDGVWLTPPLSCGLLDGCLRRELIENGPQPIVERVLRQEDLSQGKVWFGNSLRGLIPGVAVEADRRDALIA